MAVLSRAALRARLEAQLVPNAAGLFKVSNLRGLLLDVVDSLSITPSSRTKILATMARLLPDNMDASVSVLDIRDVIEEIVDSADFGTGTGTGGGAEVTVQPDPHYPNTPNTPPIPMPSV